MSLPPFFSAPLGDAGIAVAFNNLNLEEAMDVQDISISVIAPSRSSSPTPPHSNPESFYDELMNSFINFPSDQDLGVEVVAITTEVPTAPTILFAEDSPRPTRSMSFNIPIEIPVTDSTSFSTIPPTIPKPYHSRPLTFQPSEIFQDYRELPRVVTSHQGFSPSDSLAEWALGAPSSDFPSSNPSPSTSEGDPPPWIALQSAPTQHALPSFPSTLDHQLPRHRRTVSDGGLHSASARALIHGRSQSSGQLETPVNMIPPRSRPQDLARHSMNHDLLTPQPYGHDYRERRPEGLVTDARRGRSITSIRGRGVSRSRDASRGGHRSARRPSPYGHRDSSSSCSNTQLSPEAPFIYPHCPTPSFEGSPQSHCQWDGYADPPPSPSPSPSPSIPASYSPLPSVLSLEQAYLPDDRGEGSSHQGNFRSYPTSISASSQDGGQDADVESDGEDFGPCKTTRAARRASEARRRGDHHFICKYCKEGFTRKESLESHYRSRKGIKEFLCNLCQRAFTNGRDRNRHEKSVHKDINSGPD